MKNFIALIRNTERRQLALAAVFITLFGAANYGVSKLAGLAVAVPDGRSVSDAGTSGYVLGFLAAFVFTDVARWAKRAWNVRTQRTETAAE